MKGLFSKDTLRGDIFGGITAGIVAIPLALAFGLQSGMGAIYGLYGAFAIGIVAAIFGGTPTQISGPTGPMTVVTAQVVTMAVLTAGSLEKGLGLIIGSFLMAGALQVLMGIFGLGKAVRYIPYPVLSGFMSGIGIIIILLQLFPFMGHVPPSSTVKVLFTIGQPLSNISWAALLLGVATIVIIYGFPRISKVIPSPLVALLVVTSAAYWMKLDVPIIGDVPEGLPKILLGSLFSISMGDFGLIFQFGAMLAALGAIDSLLTSVVADNVTKTRHDSNRELVGQGLGNMASACIGGIPGAGATMRTVVNVNSGGRTRLSGAIHGFLLFVLLVGAGPLARVIPLSVLAGILITVGIGIIDYKGFRQLARIPRSDAAILLIVVTLTVFWNLLAAVGIGLVLAAIIFMKQASDLGENESKSKKLTEFDNDKPWSDEKEFVSQFGEDIYIKHLYGPLFFGFAFAFKTLVNDMPTVKHVVIRMEKVPYVDQSGAYALEEALVELTDRGIKVAISGLNQESHQRLERMEIVPRLIENEMIFDNFEDCIARLREELMPKVPLQS